jgi:uncharacterized Tic20 family protein
MKPKSKKEIINICQSNFSNYSTLSKVLIIISLVLSAAAVAFFICGYVVPTIQSIMICEIVGWEVVWKIFVGILLYLGLKMANLLLISIGGAAMCREEGWDTTDFAVAWSDIYEYENYIKEDDENSEE